jgi:SH3-like domain-containing protein
MRLNPFIHNKEQIDMIRLSLLLSLVLILYPAIPAHSKMLSVKAEKVQVMSEPETNSSVKWEYAKGFPVDTKSFRGKWVKVEDFEKDSGWVLKNLLSDEPAVIVKANKNSEGKINIHTSADKDSKIIGQAFYGVVFKKVEYKNGWVKVKHDSGLTGWVKSSLLWGD